MIDLFIAIALGVLGTLVIVFREQIARLMHRRMTSWYGEPTADHLLNPQRTPRTFAMVGAVAIVWGVIKMGFALAALIG